MAQGVDHSIRLKVLESHLIQPQANVHNPKAVYPFCVPATRFGTQRSTLLVWEGPSGPPIPIIAVAFAASLGCMVRHGGAGPFWVFFHSPMWIHTLVTNVDAAYSGRTWLHSHGCASCRQGLTSLQVYLHARFCSCFVETVCCRVSRIKNQWAGQFLLLKNVVFA